jgi:hypothetical protein
MMPRYLFQIGERRGDIERLEEDLPGDNEAILAARFFVADIIRDAALCGRRPDETLEVFDQQDRLIVRLTCGDCGGPPPKQTTGPNGGEHGTDEKRSRTRPSV